MLTEPKVVGVCTGFAASAFINADLVIPDFSDLTFALVEQLVKVN